jgi:hypothetical protein
MPDLPPGNLSPNESQTADSGDERPFKRKPRFTTLRGVRREFGALYLDLMNGRVAQKVAGTAGTLLSGIVKALEVELLETRVGQLEQRAELIAAERGKSGVPRDRPH